MNYLVTITLLRHQYPAVAHILTHSVNLAFGPQKYVGLGFQNEARLQFCDKLYQKKILLKRKSSFIELCFSTNFVFNT